MILLNLALMLAIGADILQVTGLWWFSAHVSKAAPRAPVTTMLKPIRTKPVSAMMPKDWYPFGQTAMSQLVQTEKIPQSAPDTALNLTLLGIFYFEQTEPDSTENRSARALIKGPNMVEKGFAVDATLPGNVQIVAIYPDRVILKRNNQFETLRLPKQTEKPRT